jgi:DNA (cytosine-5)-methyltransferase 1
LDLFSGCGGFTQGFHEFRPDTRAAVDGPAFSSLAAVEHDRSAAATYAANFGSLRSADGAGQARVYVGDIELWKPADAELQAEVIVGGPPCQGFSGLNREKVGSERNSLWREYVRIVSIVKPKIFVIENVERFLRSSEFDDLLTEVSPGGILADYRLVDPIEASPQDSPRKRAGRYVLNSADYGAVQARRRAIVIGVRKDCERGELLRYPLPTHASRSKITKAQQRLFDTESAKLLQWNPVDRVFDESSRLRIRGTDLPDAWEWFQEVEDKVRGVFTTRDLHIGRNPELLSLARYEAIRRGGNRNDLRGKWFTVDEFGKTRILDAASLPDVSTPVKYLSTESWDNHKSGSGDVMGRVRLGDPSVTIRTEFYKPEKGRYLHPIKNRPITHYEAARIQGFPLDFRWCGTKVAIAKQIGNAVPIPLGRAIASALYECLRGSAAAASGKRAAGVEPSTLE